MPRASFLARLVLPALMGRLALGNSQAAPSVYQYEGLRLKPNFGNQALLEGYQNISLSLTLDQTYENGSATRTNIIDFKISGNGIDHLGPQDGAQLTDISHLSFENGMIFDWYLRVFVPNDIQGHTLSLITAYMAGSVESDRIGLIDGGGSGLLAELRLRESAGSWTLPSALPPVPEPSTWALLLAGLAAVG